MKLMSGRWRERSTVINTKKVADLAESRGSNEEGCRVLVTTWRTAGGLVVALQHIFVHRPSLDEVIVLKPELIHKYFM